jgi:hypothetical protein
VVDLVPGEKLDLAPTKTAGTPAESNKRWWQWWRPRYPNHPGALHTLGWLAHTAPFVAGIGLVLYIIGLPADSFTALGTGIGAALAAAVTGSLAGFLFGLPRSAQEGDGTRGRQGFEENTNLEQISDWLTKILVGVGLIQIGNAGDPARRLVATVAEGMGGTPAARVVAASLLLTAAAWGFLVSYMLSRVRAGRVFRSAVLDVARKAATETTQERLRDSSRAGADALFLAHQALNPPPGTRPPSVQELRDALAAASPVIRLEVFYLARQQRQQTWRHDKERAGRTVPVFRALLGLDSDRTYRDHGELAYALKDKEEPAYDEAAAEFTNAIHLRGEARDHGWLMFEFNRAICRIELEMAGKSGQASSERTRSEVLADLRTAAQDGRVAHIIATETTSIQPWLERNGLSSDDLMPWQPLPKG